MLADVVSWYLSAVSAFWGDFLRMGVLQILLVVLALWWIGGRGRCCSGLSGWFGRWCAKGSADGGCCAEDCCVRCCWAKTRCCRNRDRGGEADECCTEGACDEAAGDDPGPPGPEDDELPVD